MRLVRVRFMSSRLYSHALIKMSRMLAPWKTCWSGEHMQLGYSILVSTSGFQTFERSLQAPANAQTCLLAEAETSRSAWYPRMQVLVEFVLHGPSSAFPCPHTQRYVGVMSGLCRVSASLMSGPSPSQGGVICPRKGHLDPA